VCFVRKRFDAAPETYRIQTVTKERYMTRLSLPAYENLTTDQKRVYDDIAAGPRGSVRGPLAVWLNRPELADAAQSLGRYCRYDCSLPKKLRELAILTTARIWDAEFEWAAHVNHAREAGLSEEIIHALRNDLDVPLTPGAETVVFDVTHRLNTTRALPNALYGKAIDILGRDQFVDLIGLLGYYSLISMTIKAFEIDPNELNEHDKQLD
jgi:4-carboxymuconolactone decarboxylase